MANELLKRRSVPSSMFRRAIVAAFVLFVIFSFKQAVAAITNGGFEEPLDTYFFQTSTTIPGWILTYQDSSYNNSAFWFSSGGTERERCMAIDATPNQSYGYGSAHLTLSTDSSFSAPSSSSVSFDYKVHFEEIPEDISSPSASVDLITTQGTLVQTFSATQNWTHFSFTVPSNAEASKLEFHADGYSYAGKRGNAYSRTYLFIDNVQVTPAPEPSVIALLVVGLGGLPVIAWQRWRDRKKAKGGE